MSRRRADPAGEYLTAEQADPLGKKALPQPDGHTNPWARITTAGTQFKFLPSLTPPRGLTGTGPAIDQRGGQRRSECIASIVNMQSRA